MNPPSASTAEICCAPKLLRFDPPKRNRYYVSCPINGPSLLGLLVAEHAAPARVALQPGQPFNLVGASQIANRIAHRIAVRFLAVSSVANRLPELIWIASIRPPRASSPVLSQTNGFFMGTENAIASRQSSGATATATEVAARILNKLGPQRD